jgi:hypothetical protein
MTARARMPSARARHVVACAVATRVEEARRTRHAPHAAAVRANKHVCMLRWLFNLLQVRKNCQSAVTATSQVLRPHTPAQSGCPPLPVPVLAPQASTPTACARDCVRQGRAHIRPRARDRAAPSERDGAIDHEDCASAILRTAPVRDRPAARTQPEGPDRRARPKGDAPLRSCRRSPRRRTRPRI